MIPRRKRLALMIVLLLTFAIAVPRIPLIRPRAVSVSQGNWIVSGTEVNQSESIVLNGNLTIESGGNLTLRNVDLTLNPQYNGEFGITVDSGGSMYIYNSTITSSSASIAYTFEVDGTSNPSNTHFVMSSSGLHGAGWCDGQLSSCSNIGPDTPHPGLVVASTGAIITHDLISQNLVGLVLENSNATIAYDNFTGNYVGLMGLFSSSYDNITGNYLHVYANFDSWAVQMDNSNHDVFRNNTMTFASPPVTNGIWPGDGGFNLGGSSDNLFVNNSIFNSEPFAALGSDYNNSIIDNKIIAKGDSAIFMQDSPYTRIIGNQIVQVAKPVPEGVAGITMIACPNSTIANNLISGGNASDPLSYPLFLAHSPNSYVLNNNVTTVTNVQSVFLYGTNDTLVAGNTISNGGGLRLGPFSDNNKITDNTIYANFSLSYGGYVLEGSSVVLDNASENLIYQNNFYDNGGGAYDSGIGNSWSSNEVGNFWSAYQGQGRFTISPNGVDYSPLPNPVAITPKSVPTVTEAQAPPFTGTLTKIVVSQSVTISNEVTTMPEGSINVETGGNLIIENSTLTIGSNFGFNVAQGGSLTIENCSIIGGSGFSVSQGANSTILDSRLLVGQNQTFAVYTQGSMSIDHTSILLKGPFGFYFEDRSGGNAASMLNISNSVLEGASTFWQLGGSLDISYGSLIVNNSLIEGDVSDIGFSGNYASVTNSSLIGAAFGPSISANKIVFEGNMVEENGASLSAPNVTFSKNNITSDWGSFIQIFADSASIVGNKIDYERGFQPLAVWASNSIIRNNFVSNMLSNGMGISLNGNNLTVAGNDEIGAGGLSLSGSYGILTNNTVSNAMYGLGVYGSNNIAYHNNIINCTNAAGQSGSNDSWSYGGEGNYWSSYTGSDPDLDGIGNTPFMGDGISDNYPFMQPNGWLTKFYLAVQTNLTTFSFEINGSTFGTGSNGVGTYRLGYDANYTFSFPQVVTLSNVTIFQFAKWSDGFSGTTRTLPLSSNSTIEVFYQKQSQQQTTTTSVTASSSSSSKTVSSHSTTSSVTSTESSSQSSTASKGGGIPELPYSVAIVAVFVVIIVGVYMFVRRKSGMRNPIT